ncbi:MULTISPECIES: hypothetical protein [unclassified Pseudomonas]|uniref:hypothetical protein n=1 Tax=unclassified Pseudomonas TaxID=196821 RepID=UPI001CBE7AA8|nr:MULTISPECIES: hypothetical protein [unclassified Pseudomonas]
MSGIIASADDFFVTQVLGQFEDRQRDVQNILCELATQQGNEPQLNSRIERLMQTTVYRVAYRVGTQSISSTGMG